MPVCWSEHLEQLELHRAAGLLLRDGCTRAHPTAADEIADPHPDDVAPPQLAIARSNMARSRSRRSQSSQKANRPGLLRLQRPLGAHQPSSIPWPLLSSCRVEL
jgi:hypothetical protein